MVTSAQDSLLKWLSTLVVFVAGIAIGWFLHSRGIESHPEVTIESIADSHKPAELDIRQLYQQNRLPEVVQLSHGASNIVWALIGTSHSDKSLRLLGLYMQAYGDFFDGLLWLASAESERGHHQVALDLMQRADLLATSPADQSRFSERLEHIVKNYARNLLADGNVDALDKLYEEMTYQMPEQAVFFLKLGLLRIRVGKYEQALQPLAQIENHMVYGEQARQLIKLTEVQETPIVAEVVPLRRHGDQFVVTANIDQQHTVNLLIDTGAAMTIVDADDLQQFGYELADKQQGYFSTANGVVEAPVISVDQVSLGSAAMGPISIGALPLSLPQGVDGLLGMNYLRHYNFHIDQQSEELHLSARQ